MTVERDETARHIEEGFVVKSKGSSQSWRQIIYIIVRPAKIVTKGSQSTLSHRIIRAC